MARERINIFRVSKFEKMKLHKDYLRRLKESKSKKRKYIPLSKRQTKYFRTTSSKFEIMKLKRFFKVM